MGAHESLSQTDEWYTPAWVFEAFGLPGRSCFDLDPCASRQSPASSFCTDIVIKSRDYDGLTIEWWGHVWLNPPFGKRNAVLPWLEKMVRHGDGIALLPNRTGAPWWQYVAGEAELILFHAGKIKFDRADGEPSESPGFGNTFMAFGEEMRDRLFFSDLKGLRRQ